jgi:hypothetical protein
MKDLTEFANVIKYLTDEEAGRIFRQLVEESVEEKQQRSERQRNNANKRYQTKKNTEVAESGTAKPCQNGVSQEVAEPEAATSLPPTPPISDDIYINNNINISNQGFDASTDTQDSSSVTSPCTSSNKFQKPTLEEVKSYVAEKGYTVNPEKFYAYYEAGGWMVGKRPMKSWRMALTYWHNNGIDRSQHPPNTTSKRVAEQNYTQREYTDEQLDSLIADI